MKPVVLAMCTAALVLGAAPALAQRTLEVQAAGGERRVALVIGNAAYADAPLANPVNDATDMAKALEDAGFKVILRRNASTREMRQAIRDFGAELRRADVGLFYFAGHGVQVRGNNYLLPVGADIQSEADAEDLAIDANYALRTMEDAQAKVTILVLDACRNNPFTRAFRSATRGLAQMNAATGSVIAFATAPGSVAADGAGRNGVYTKHLLANLQQGDSDILKVFQRTRAGVVKETAGRQTPWESTSLIGDFHFKPGSTATAMAAPMQASPLPAAPRKCEIKRISFTDGSTACMEDFEVFHNMRPPPQGIALIEYFRGKSSSTYALPTPGKPCRPNHGWAFNSPTHQHNDAAAVSACEQYSKQQDFRCTCMALIRSDGNVLMTQREFVKVLFANAYAILDMRIAEDASRAPGLREGKSKFMASEQRHYARIEREALARQ